MTEPKNEKAVWLKQLGLFSIISFEILLFTGMGMGAGYTLYLKLGFSEWSIVVGAGIGLVLSFVTIYQYFKKMESSQNES